MRRGEIGFENPDMIRFNDGNFRRDNLDSQRNSRKNTQVRKDELFRGRATAATAATT